MWCRSFLSSLPTLSGPSENQAATDTCGLCFCGLESPLPGRCQRPSAMASGPQGSRSLWAATLNIWSWMDSCCWLSALGSWWKIQHFPCWHSCSGEFSRASWILFRKFHCSDLYLCEQLVWKGVCRPLRPGPPARSGHCTVLSLATAWPGPEGLGEASGGGLHTHLFFRGKAYARCKPVSQSLLENISKQSSDYCWLRNQTGPLACHFLKTSQYKTLPGPSLKPDAIRCPDISFSPHEGFWLRKVFYET